MGTITILAMETNQQEAQGKASSQQPVLARPTSLETFCFTLIFPFNTKALQLIQRDRVFLFVANRPGLSP